MNMIGKIGIGAAIVAIVVAIVPAIKGPYNRIRNEVNESLNQEFVVDNYKAEYIQHSDFLSFFNCHFYNSTLLSLLKKVKSF